MYNLPRLLLAADLAWLRRLSGEPGGPRHRRGRSVLNELERFDRLPKGKEIKSIFVFS